MTFLGWFLVAVLTAVMAVCTFGPWLAVEVDEYRKRKASVKARDVRRANGMK